jgi:hypothetical protein
LLGCRTDVDEDPQLDVPTAAAITTAISNPLAVDVWLSTHLRRARERSGFTTCMTSASLTVEVKLAQR